MSDYCGNIKEKDVIKVKYPVYNLSLDDIELSNNSLDDYQRLVFLIIFINLSKENVSDKIINRNLNIKITKYKSNIAQYMNTKKTESENLILNLLNCFEYKLPDLKKITNEEFDSIISINSLTKEFKDQLSIPQFINNNKYLQILKNLNIVNSINVETENENNESIDTLDQKQESVEKQNKNLINPNNTIIWTHDTGYVYLTGIWRLYQDVMKALVNCKRGSNELDDNYDSKPLNKPNKPSISTSSDANTSTSGSSTNENPGPDSKEEYINENCQDEFEFVMNHIFYDDLETLDLRTIKIRKKRRNSMRAYPISNSKSTIGSTNPNNINNINNDGNSTEITASTTNYTDLHWNNLSTDLKDYLLKVFKDFLIVKKKVPEANLKDLTVNDLIQRIRGGYIKIQGTWLPWEISRILCVRFCYPIRYLLVPLFGSNFPEECEQWHSNITEKILNNSTTNKLKKNQSNSNKIKSRELSTNKNTTIRSQDIRKKSTQMNTPKIKHKRKKIEHNSQIKNHLSKAFKILLKVAEDKEKFGKPSTDLNFARYNSYRYPGSTRLLLLSIPTLIKNSDADINSKLPSLNYTLSDNSFKSKVYGDISVDRYLERYKELKIERKIQLDRQQKRLKKKQKKDQLKNQNIQTAYNTNSGNGTIVISNDNQVVVPNSISPKSSLSHIPVYISPHSNDTIASQQLSRERQFIPPTSSKPSYYYNTNGHRYSFPMNMRHPSYQTTQQIPLPDRQRSTVVEPVDSRNLANGLTVNQNYNFQPTDYNGFSGNQPVGMIPRTTGWNQYSISSNNQQSQMQSQYYQYQQVYYQPQVNSNPTLQPFHYPITNSIPQGFMNPLTTYDAQSEAAYRQPYIYNNQQNSQNVIE